MTTIEKLRKLVEEATPGPWAVNRHGCIEGGHPIQYLRGQAKAQVALCVGSETVDQGMREANTALIAAAVNLLPLFLDIAEAAEKAIPLIKEDDEGAVTTILNPDTWDELKRMETALAKLKEAEKPK